MRVVRIEQGFPDWRRAARELLSKGVPPAEVVWSEDASLLGDESIADEQIAHQPVPRKFLALCERIACHCDPEKWSLLYRTLWRLTHGEPQLLNVLIDADVYRLALMEKAIRRDAHKMKAFVRFRKVESEIEPQYVAWHRPDHHVLRLVTPFFVSRFGVMQWTILTPDESVSWIDGKLLPGPGVPQSEAPQADALEDLWRIYYGAIFNPARIKLKAMRKEMPRRYWPTMPETQIIDDLLRDAPRRMEEMMKHAARPTATSAADFLPKKLELPVLAKAVNDCRGCQIYCNATQAVFGEGPADARCMFVGEQPGDQEDLAGKPFVGPAGALLDEAMQSAGVPRKEIYVTNAVKHFKWEPGGKRRIHAKPSAREVAACRPWLEAEIKALQPQMIVCLGATAAQTLLGSGFRLTQHRGEIQKQTVWAPWVLATVHPSSLLRIPDSESRAQATDQFIGDLKIVAKALKAAR